DWQLQVVNILSLCSNIERVPGSRSLQILRICNELVSSRLIEISNIADAINLLQMSDSENILSQEFVEHILELFNKIPITEQTIASQCSFFRLCIEIILLNSPLRIHLYKILFGKESCPLFGSVLSSVLIEVIKMESVTLPRIIQNTSAILDDSIHLNAINAALKSNHLDSPIFALCVDAMQRNFFSFCSFQDLLNSFQDAVNILRSTNVEPLQSILAVALLKEFVNNLWKSLVSIRDATREPLEFNVDVDMNRLVKNINRAMERQSLQIRSLKLYFLRDLYAKGLSLHEIKCFGKVQCGIFPWLNDLEWSDDDNRMGFVPYRCYDQYNEAEEAFEPLYTRGQHMKAENFLNYVLTDSSISKKMSLMGIAISRLRDICALRELSLHEKTMIQFLQTQLSNMPFDNFYREKLLSFITNTHQLYLISPEISQAELLIRSVIVHIIALHSCLSASNSPLAAYLKSLKTCKDTYILTSSSDVDANILIEIGEALGQFTRYECECGFKYIVTECGDTREEGICPRCKSRIGGINNKVNPGNRRIDAQTIRGNEETNERTGYAYESTESRKDSNYRIRDMTSASYRVLHLFVHTLIAATSREDCQDFFNNLQDPKVIKEPIEYCKRHIENDWHILTCLFDCNDETLALVLHSILSSMAKNPITTFVRLDTMEKRRLWELEFTHRYITSQVINAHSTASEFQKLVKNVQHKLESEINETLGDEDCHDNFYPGIWRRTTEASFENLRTYCARYQNFAIEFPFLSLFFEYEERLSLLKNLSPIVNFVRILSSKLSFRLKREDTLHFTFNRFLDNEGPSTGNLKKAFENFSKAWNLIRHHITRYKCQEFIKPMPEMNGNISVSYALVEEENESLYICGAIEYLVNLQNIFLQQVLTIKPDCSSLGFLEQEQFLNDKVGNQASQRRYKIKSLPLSKASDDNIINYEWNSQLLSHSQRDLRLGHGHKIQYELCKIETELAHSLIFNKVYLSEGHKSFWLDTFTYHQELFSNYPTILSEIREFIPQEVISADKLGIPLPENPTELLSELEILLFFLKQTLGDREMNIIDYLSKWIKLSALTGSDQFCKMTKELRLKHVISLYEMVEGKVAEVEIESLDEKYKYKLSKQLQDEIVAGVDFELSHGVGRNRIRKLRIPHEAFATALKRFMFRYLRSERFSEKDKLADYLAEEIIIDCWQAWVSKDIIREKFPKSLLVANAYDAYKFIMNKFRINSGGDGKNEPMDNKR
ncbi:18286_t:CDS:2, partial [Acaulospora morrowiae]